MKTDEINLFGYQDCFHETVTTHNEVYSHLNVLGVKKQAVQGSKSVWGEIDRLVIEVQKLFSKRRNAPLIRA